MFPSRPSCQPSEKRWLSHRTGCKKNPGRRDPSGGMTLQVVTRDGKISVQRKQNSGDSTSEDVNAAGVDGHDSFNVRSGEAAQAWDLRALRNVIGHVHGSTRNAMGSKTSLKFHRP